MATKPSSTSPFGVVTLVSGQAEFLSERTVARLLGIAGAEAPEADVSDVSAASIAAGELAALTSPSLFSSVRTLVVRDLSELADEAHKDLLAYAGAPSPDVACVLVHPGGNKGKGLLDKLRKLDAVSEVKTVSPKPWELGGWVVSEVREHGGAITDDAASFLVAAVGNDLRALAAACDQLVSAIAPAQGGKPRITIELVRQYFDGRAEVKSFDIADAAIEGRLGVALEQLRWAIGNHVAPVLITSAFASGLRSLAKLQSAPRGLRDTDLAREIGAPAFRVRSLRAQLRSWESAGLASALSSVAVADLDVKGGAGDPEYALEHMVLSVYRARSR
ncbi:DNA polymerase III subunit delta [Solicola gregarius]|uniref:DNA-directed DNA polymerase n=1 Tax=Solicola gregarius TaxID=2908642 RepID=A0AA46YMH1_9ACTN|nr:DNA polymerase III subunit delta [Solicola gregarius]UYM05758.1 DNA polymerase III subunit delta [Solicola gregarius]